MELKHLQQEIDKLNAPIVVEIDSIEESFDSLYDFTCKLQTNSILIYDRNEYFNIDIDEEVRCMAYSACNEFGFEYKTPESTEERIIGLFKAALEKDLNNSVEIEWQDTVCLCAYFVSKLKNTKIGGLTK